MCSGHGACLTLRELAALAYNDRKELSGAVYSTPWDADMIRGCACARALSVDNQVRLSPPPAWNRCGAGRVTHCLMPLPISFPHQYDTAYVVQLPWLHQHLHNSTYVPPDYAKEFYRGPFAHAATDFTGYGCAASACPSGDDPATSPASNEIQLLRCNATSGLFFLTFRGNTTLPIRHNDTFAVLQKRLQQLFTIGNVTVTAGQTNSRTVCNASLPVYIEFLTEFGDLPMLTANLHALTHTYFSLSEYLKGTKEDVECSRKGVCNPATGRCRCVNGYSSSNGTVTSPGSRGDCSFRNMFNTLS